MKCLLAAFVLALGPELYAGDAPTEPFVSEGRTRFQPFPHMLSDAVRAADLIFMGATTRVDFSQYHGIGKGTYSGIVVPKTFLKGHLEQREVNLIWEPSATGIKTGSNHIFFVRTNNGGFNVAKEIYVHEPPYMCSRTYWFYDGGTEATVQSIHLLVKPSESVPAYAETLLADLKQPAVQRQATAVMLACETMRAECLDPLLYAITNHVEHYLEAVYGACRLDGTWGATAALGQIASHPNEQAEIFAPIAAAKNPKSVSILEHFGDAHPDCRVSCAFAIREIDSSHLAEIIHRWQADGKDSQIVHTFFTSEDSPPYRFTADDLLVRALNRRKLFERE
jgi:hypothetical protein